MSRLRAIVLSLALILTSAGLVTPAYADGIIVPEPPICDPFPCPRPFPMAQLAIEYHRVSVTIHNQVATTHVDQVFRNDNDWAVEGTYIFPLPSGAMVNDFTLWIDGEPIQGEVLTREQARKTYEEIVRNLRDPALLEYLERGAVQASIFPIPPGGTRRIELEYTQVLESDAGLFHYIYPLNTEKFSTQPLEHVSVSISVESPQPVRAIYSPSHALAISREGEYAFTAGYEDADVTPDQDFELFYSVSREDIGLSLLSFRDTKSDDPGGFFLLLAAPSVEVSGTGAIPKDLIFVLDQSGSMEGEKFIQAQKALSYVLEHLNPNDRFSIIAFSTGTRSYAGSLRPAGEAAQASRWVDRLSAQGSTDINRALLEAVDMADAERTTILIFLTDGLPTEGVTNSQSILQNLMQAASRNIRLFAFGVGYDVDTFLLDSLAQAHHGATTYVSPGQSIDESVSSFYTKVSTPVLTDLEIDFGEAIVYDLYPSPLPDLFAGGQLILVGRYRQPATTNIRLSGSVSGQKQVFTYTEQVFGSKGGEDFLPRLWATRKIGHLLNTIRLNGVEKELVEQIVQLSIRYGIITPYTSYLVTEPAFLGEEAQESLADQVFEQIQSLPAIVSGQEAFERAAAEAEIGRAEAPLAPSGEMLEIVRVVGSHTFRLIDGVWTDTAFDPDQMGTIRVSFLSEDYFSLVETLPDLAAAFSLGQQVIAVSGSQSYEVVDSDQPGDPFELPDPEDEEDDWSPSSGEGRDDEPVQIQVPSLPCPSFVIPFGLLAAPMFYRRRRTRGS